MSPDMMYKGAMITIHVCDVQGVNVKGYNHLLHTTVFRTHLLSPFIMYLYFDINLSCNRTSQYLFNCSPVVTLHLYEEIRKTL